MIAHYRTTPRQEALSIKRQAGGTVLGILIGIVLGLAVAVVTALLVTKTTLPFVGPPGKSSERASGPTTAAAPSTGTVPEAPKPQVPVAPGDTPDPNRTAASRQRSAPGQMPADRREVATVNASAPTVPPVLPLPPSAAGGASGAGTAGSAGGAGVIGGTFRPGTATGAPGAQGATGAPVAPTGAASGEGQAPIRAAVPSFSPVPGSNSATLPGAAPPSQAAVAGAERGATYLLQAGAFRGPDDADAMKLRLALMGLEAQIVTADVSGTTLYRVRVGPYAGLDSMNKARARLAENGVEATVLRQR